MYSETISLSPRGFGLKQYASLGSVYKNKLRIITETIFFALIISTGNEVFLTGDLIALLKILHGEIRLADVPV